MKAFKAFKTDLTCLGYSFTESGWNETEEANCKCNGFHCAENPLDCLSYYPDWKSSVYYEVEAAGDLDEDGVDSKISCTKLRLVRRLTLTQFLLEAILYMVQHPKRSWNSHVHHEQGIARNGFIIVRGKEPVAQGDKGDVVAILKENDDGEILEVGLFEAEESGVWYDVYGNCIETPRREALRKCKAA